MLVIDISETVGQRGGYSVLIVGYQPAPAEDNKPSTMLSTFMVHNCHRELVRYGVEETCDDAVDFPVRFFFASLWCLAQLCQNAKQFMDYTVRILLKYKFLRQNTNANDAASNVEAVCELESVVRPLLLKTFSKLHRDHLQQQILLQLLSRLIGCSECWRLSFFVNLQGRLRTRFFNLQGRLR